MTPTPSRRTLLRGASIAAATGLAGCLSAVLGDSGFRDVCADDELVRNRTLAVDGAWAEFQADAGNTGYNPDETGPSDPSVAWRYATCYPMEAAPPVVADGSVYVSTEGLSAFDARTGEREWRVPDIDSAVAPIVTEDTVYFAGRDLVAVNPRDGTVRWRAERDSDTRASRSPALADGRLFVPSVGRRTLRGYDAATGEQRWIRSLGGDSSPSAPAVADGRVYVTDAAKRLVSLDTDGRDLRVLAGGPGDGGVFTSPAVRGGTVYVGGLEGHVRALDAATGEERWTTRLSENAFRGPPVVAEDLLYVVENGVVYGLSTETGEEVWTADGSGLGLPVRAGDALYVGGTDYVGDEPSGLVRSYDAATGELRWERRTRAYVDADDQVEYLGTEAPVAVADGVVFVATGYGDLFAFADA